MPDINWNSAIRKQFILHPEKFALMGQYAREMLDCAEIEDYLSDMLMLRLSTTVLCGSTISENPVVEVKVPASWFQHGKHALAKWHEGRDGELLYFARKHRPVRLWILIPVIRMLGMWLRRHPVRYSKLTAEINFEQRILYPEVDAPAQAGRPVIYETMEMFPLWEPKADSWGTSLQRDPSRFMHRHEIAREIYRDPELARYPNDLNSPHATLNWLERNGVNVDQLVKRK